MRNERESNRRPEYTDLHCMPNFNGVTHETCKLISLFTKSNKGLHTPHIRIGRADFDANMQAHEYLNVRILVATTPHKLSTKKSTANLFILVLFPTWAHTVLWFSSSACSVSNFLLTHTSALAIMLLCSHYRADLERSSNGMKAQREMMMMTCFSREWSKTLGARFGITSTSGNSAVLEKSYSLLVMHFLAFTFAAARCNRAAFAFVSCNKIEFVPCARSVVWKRTHNSCFCSRFSFSFMRTRKWGMHPHNYPSGCEPWNCFELNARNVARATSSILQTTQKNALGKELPFISLVSFYVERWTLRMGI